jgi:Uncharacterised nucleotidyltransferase
MRSEIWAGADRIIDRAPSLADLRSHRLHLLAAKRWRDLGLDVPEELAQEETASAWLVLAAPHVLTHVRNAYDGQLLVMKGPEVAGHYPDPASRLYGDLDILADDPEAAQRALISAGFEPTGFHDDYYEGLHHLRPLRLRHCPLPSVEIHRRPNWVDWVDPPSSRELFAAAVPGSLPVPGLLALPPAHHALALAAHSWSWLPLRRVRDLIDILAVSADADRSGLDALARHWGIGRLWNTMLAAAEALILDGPQPWTLRAWARSLRDIRDMTVLEGHARRWFSPFSALPMGRALPQAGLALGRELVPIPEESWAHKLRRAGEAMCNPSRRLADHTRLLGEEGRKPRFKRR